MDGNLSEPQLYYILLSPKVRPVRSCVSTGTDTAGQNSMVEIH